MDDPLHGSLRRLVSTMFGALALRVLGLALSAAGLAVVSRLLSMDQYGDYLLSLSLVTLGNCLAGLGLPAAIIRLLADTSKSPRNRGDSLATAAIITLFWSIVVGIGCAIARGWLHRSETTAAGLELQSVWLCAWVVTSTLTVLLGETFRGLRMIGLAGVFGSVIAPLLHCAMLLGLRGVLEMSVTDVLMLAVASHAVALAMGLLMFGAICPHHRIALPTGVLSLVPLSAGLLRESAPMMVIALCTLVLGQIDLWVVGSTCALSEAALYGSAARLMALIALPLAAVNLTIPPRIAAMHFAQRTAEMESMLRSTATLAAGAALVMTTIVVIGAEPILRLLFGPGFEQGATVLRCLAIGQLVVNWSGSPGFTLMMTGHRKWAMYSSLITVIYVSAISLWLTPIYGTTATALVAVSGIVFHRIILINVAWRVLNVWCPAYSWPTRGLRVVAHSGG